MFIVDLFIPEQLSIYQNLHYSQVSLIHWEIEDVTLTMQM